MGSSPGRALAGWTPTALCSPVARPARHPQCSLPGLDEEPLNNVGNAMAQWCFADAWI